MDAQGRSAEKCCLVGHGNSPKGRGWGSLIDEHVVVRLKNPSWQTKEDYGTRTDYMAASTETMQIMLDYKTVPKGYWAQPKRGKWNPATEAAFRSRSQAPLKIPIEIHNHWNSVFRGLTEDKDCPNHSLGMAAITYVCEFLKPRIIKLVGFDNMLNPTLLDYHKADRGVWVTRHDWKTEHGMLDMIRSHYGVAIDGLR